MAWTACREPLQVAHLNTDTHVGYLDQCFPEIAFAEELLSVFVEEQPFFY